MAQCRLAWVIGFTMGPFPGNERTWKPFNPILGETFELGMDNGLRFIAEQVWFLPLQCSVVQPGCKVITAASLCSLPR